MRDKWQNQKYFEHRIAESMRLAEENYTEEKLNKFKKSS